MHRRCPHDKRVCRIWLGAAWSQTIGLLMLGATASADEPQVVFKDRTADVGLTISTAAACWADFDNDGWIDLCAEGVWKNLEGKSFKKVAVDLSTGVRREFDVRRELDEVLKSISPQLKKNGPGTRRSAQGGQGRVFGHCGGAEGALPRLRSGVSGVG